MLCISDCIVISNIDFKNIKLIAYNISLLYVYEYRVLNILYYLNLTLNFVMS